jgi:hypothetical protein
MKASILIAAMLFSWSVGAGAQQSATTIATTGPGELVRTSEAKISGGGRYEGIRLPETISVGDVFPIQYQQDGGTVTDSFVVTGIVVNDVRCTLESKNSRIPAALPEMIFVSCKKTR